MLDCWTSTTADDEGKKQFGKCPVGVEAPCYDGRMVCLFMHACVCVCGLSRWTKDQYGRTGVTTETRASKLRGMLPETWHFQVALIQGYRINLTLLSEWVPGRK